MGKPKISVIVPMHNVEEYIQQCATSLFEQSYENMEYIFVDDCSLDGTVEKLNKCMSDYPHRMEQVVVLRNETNRGVAFSRKRGLHNATGEYIGWCDADDWVEKCMFDCMLRQLEVTQSDLVYCNYYWWGRILQLPDLCNPNKEICICNYLKDNVNPLWNKLTYRKLYTENHIDFEDGQDYCEDYCISVKLLYYAQKITFLDEPYYHYRANTTSICHVDSKDKFLSGFNNTINVYSFLIGNGIGTKGELNHFLIYRVVNKKISLLFYDNDISSLQIYPETNRYVFNNPYLGRKSKFVAFVVFKLYDLVRWILFHT